MWPTSQVRAALAGLILSSSQCCTNAVVRRSLEPKLTAADVQGALASGTARGPRDLAFVHVPMNYGNTISDAAAIGVDSNFEWADVTGFGKAGWEKIARVAQRDAAIWGPMNPDLQVISEESGCPMYYTPGRYWPKALAASYFGNRTIFGMLRDPYDRWVAAFRGWHGGEEHVVKGWNFTNDHEVCDISAWTKAVFKARGSWATQAKCQWQPQAPFFEGAYAISKALDVRTFPTNVQELMREHGYDNVVLDPEAMMHVTTCDDTWAGDLDDEARQLLREYYAADFELVCREFGHCDHDSMSEDRCCTHVAGMCPDKHFRWSDEAKRYERL